MSERADVIRASADALRAAIDAGDKRQILLTARDHAATLLQNSTSSRDAPPLIKQITDITDALSELDSSQETSKFDEIVSGISW